MEIKDLFSSINSFKDLEDLIKNEIRESELLEYKAAENKFSPKEKDQIPKDVSAMANSNGGVIIYGIATDEQDKTKPVNFSGLNIANIESFDRVINSQIRKEIKGVQKKIFSNDTYKCMVIFVPQSPDTPHQSLVDKKYYRRSLSESVPMEHDLIELHFGKRPGPVLDLTFINVDNKNFDALSFNEDGFSEQIKLRAMIVNTGRKIGKYVEVIFLFPDVDKIKIISADSLANIDNLYPEHKLQARQFSQNSGVFHPSMRKKIADIVISISKEYYDKDKPISLMDWIIYADEMVPRNDRVLIQDKK